MCLFFGFAPPRAFDIDQKLSRNVDEIVLSRDKSISLLLDSIGHVLLISELDFDQKLTQSVAQVTHVMSCVKRLSSPALCDWSGIFNFRV